MQAYKTKINANNGAIIVLKDLKWGVNYERKRTHKNVKRKGWIFAK